MKTIIRFLAISLLIGFALCLESCRLVENDLISQNCSSNCTMVKGQLLTNGGHSPLSDVSLTLFWEFYFAEGSETLRTKATAISDKNGDFEMKFTMRDDELSDGYFYISFNVDSTKFFNCTNYSSDIKGYEIYLPKLKPDTLVTDSYFVPAVAYLDLDITNLDEITNMTDYITTIVSSRVLNYECGPWIYWNQKLTTPLKVPAEQSVVLETIKVKEGVQTNHYDTLQLSTGEHKSFVVTF